jgi:tRNA/tmRNA/rRNA uracil-C5-methylase (TrmA/RlmC/RlmD family)
LSAAFASAGAVAPQQIELAENVDASNRVVFLDASNPLPATLLDAVAHETAFTGVAAATGTRGDVYVTDTLDLQPRPLRLRRHVQAFFQGNRFLLGALVEHVVAQVDRSAEVLDLYAGGGLFSLAIAAARAARVTSVEGDRTSASDLAVNASLVEGITPVHRGVEEYLADARGRTRFDTVIVDPPRTGMSKEAGEGIVEGALRRVVYVSCDVATLARDARRLADAGYALSKVDAFDMFPNTPHIETVAVFDR